MIEELKALKLERGGVYVIEVQREIGAERMAELGKQLKDASEDLEIRFILLSGNLRIHRQEEVVALAPEQV